MNQEERVEYHRETETYFEKNQVKDLFRQMTNQVLLDLPEDPIQYFIDHLRKKSLRKIVCVVGHSQTINDKVCNMLGSDFGYEVIDSTEDQAVSAIGNTSSDKYDHYNEILKNGLFIKPKKFFRYRQKRLCVQEFPNEYQPSFMVFKK